jgi:two-component system, sensor histidine kinase and response regulator
MANIGKPHLLIVDDHMANRTLLSRHLMHMGFETTVADSGYLALDLLKSCQFDLILLDIMMPGMTGLQVLGIIRQTHTVSELPIILTTALDESDNIVEGFTLGANDYVTKPIDFPVLLSRIRIQLQLKQLTQLKDEFIQIASHDLKNPLNNIGMSTCLLSELIAPDNKKALRIVECIDSSANDMKKIITDFLDFQAIKDGNLQLSQGRVNLNALATEIIAENSNYAQSKAVDLQFECHPGLPEVLADAARVRQVIQNFVSNAIKFCPENATVLVRTDVQDNVVMLCVGDTGPGLTDDDLAKVFGKYARLSNKPTGGEKSSGLGLAICKQLIELLGGSIGVYNNPDRGATFWFSLPGIFQGATIAETVPELMLN